MGTSKPYNLVPVKDNCALFASTSIFSGPRYPMVSLKIFHLAIPVATETNRSYSKAKFLLEFNTR